jgi:hypothetical protein
MGERMTPVPGVDPLFTDEDVVEILDFLEWKDSLCPHCGQPRHEAFAVENSYAYEVTVLQCHGCSAKARATGKLDDTHGVFAFPRLRGA